MFPNLNNSELERISNVFGDTQKGFTGSEIGRLLRLCAIPDTAPTMTKRIRLFDAFANRCNQDRNSNCVYQFIQEALMPSRWLDAPEAKNEMRKNINEVLSFKGIQITDSNQFVSVSVATTVSEAKVRATNLHRKLYEIHAHNLVMKCCNEELMASDYFHAVQEAAKSLTQRISEGTGIELDGTTLIECAFSTSNPAVVINSLRSSSEQNEHRGIKEMLLGINYAVRNVTAHEMRIKWDMNEAEAINILSIISALHKILDSCHFVRQKGV